MTRRRHTPIWTACILFVLIAIQDVAQSQETASQPKEIRFQSEIDAFLREDSLTPPPRHGILFIGSSIFRLWSHLKEQMSPLPVFNRAFGGSRTDDLLAQMERIVVPYEPMIIVYYCGSNDINAGKRAEEVFLGFRLFAERVTEKLPETFVYYVSINRAPQKMGRWDIVDSANAFAMNYCAQTPNRAFIDVNPILFDARGNPRRELFLEDELHLQDQAYLEFAEKIKPILQQRWESMQH